MKEWTKKTMNELVESYLIGIVRNKKEQGSDRQFFYVKMDNISNKNKFNGNNITKIDASETEIEKYNLCNNDFLFNTRNSHELVGKNCIFKRELLNNTNVPVLFNNNIMRIRFRKEINPKFIAYSFSSNHIKEQLENIKHGTTNVSGIYYKSLKNIIIKYPPISEQKQIVEILDKAFEGIDRAIANTKKNLANARELFDSYLNNIFDQKEEGWVENQLGDICKNLDSQRIPITKSKRKKGNIPYYGASGIVDYVDDFIFNEDLLLVSEDGANLLARIYPIAFSISGKAWVNNHAHVLRFKNMSQQKFVEYYLNSISLKEYVRGMAQPKLNQKALFSIKIPVPPLVEQEQIVKSFDLLFNETQRLKAIYQQKLEALQELKQSLLHKAFTGELTNPSTSLRNNPTIKEVAA